MAIEFIDYLNSNTLAGYLMLSETGLRNALHTELTKIAPYVDGDIFDYSSFGVRKSRQTE